MKQNKEQNTTNRKRDAKININEEYFDKLIKEREPKVDKYKQELKDLIKQKEDFLAKRVLDLFNLAIEKAKDDKEIFNNLSSVFKKLDKENDFKNLIEDDGNVEDSKQ